MSITKDASGALTPQTSLKSFYYEGQKITFRNANSLLMVNLTQMGKPFGKQPSDFLRLTQTKDFVLELEKKQSENFRFEKGDGVHICTGNTIFEKSQTGNSPTALITELVFRKKGGKNPGTWAHELIALKFAAWLSPKFELWVYERIQELTTKGVSFRSEADARAIRDGMYQEIARDYEAVNFKIAALTQTVQSMMSVISSNVNAIGRMKPEERPEERKAAVVYKSPRKLESGTVIKYSMIPDGIKKLSDDDLGAYFKLFCTMLYAAGFNREYAEELVGKGTFLRLKHLLLEDKHGNFYIKYMR